MPLNTHSQLVLPRANDGIALVTVLWLLVLLSAMVLSLNRDARLEIKTTRLYVDELHAKATLEAGVYTAIAELVSQNAIRAASQEIAGGTVIVSLIDETEKIDLNHANQSALQGLFSEQVSSDDAAKLVATIMDWRDADDDARPDGAERAAYRSAGRDYGPKNGPFLHIEELKQVLGLGPELYDKLKHRITVDGAYATVLQMRGGSDQPGSRITLQNQLTTLAASSTYGEARAHATVRVLLIGASDEPFRIVDWQWANAF